MFFPEVGVSPQLLLARSCWLLLVVQAWWLSGIHTDPWSYPTITSGHKHWCREEQLWKLVTGMPMQFHPRPEFGISSGVQEWSRIRPFWRPSFTDQASARAQQ